jgi:two-component sensor histidine kinase
MDGEMEKRAAEIRELIKGAKEDTEVVNLLTEGAMLYVTKSGDHDSDMNMATRYANKAYHISRKLGYIQGTGKCYFVYSNICREKGEIEKGTLYIKQSINILSKSGSLFDLAEAYLEESNYLNPFTQALKLKIGLYEKAILLYRKVSAKEKEAKALKQLGDLYYINDEYAKALNATRRSLQLLKEINYPKIQDVYDQMGLLSVEMGNYDDAVKYGLLAVQTAEKLKDSTMLCTIYNRLGITYYYVGQMDKANECYQVALSLAMRKRDTMSIMDIANNIVDSYLKMGKPLKAIAFLKPIGKAFRHTLAYKESAMAKSFLMSYISAKKYEEAKPYMQEMLKLSQLFPINEPVQFSLLPCIIDYYLATGQYNNAIYYCNIMVPLCKKYDHFNDLKRTHYSWFKAESGLKNYKVALEQYQMFTTVRDSLNTVEEKRRISQIQVQYETEKKEKDIQLLTKQHQLNKSKLEQATVSRNITLAGILVTLSVSGLLFNRYKLKQRSNKKLELQQKEINEKNAHLQHLVTEKEWLLKEIHHRIKNNLQTVISLLNSQSAYLNNDAALTAIQDSQHRIYAMSLIHQKLYTTENVSTIDMPVYIRDLVGYMRDSFGIGKRIQFNFEIVSLKLDVSQAIPLALILNEAITNSLKYAFPSHRVGIINISLRQEYESRYVLRIADNGVGMPLSLDQSINTLGMSLMKGLSEDLDGSFKIERDNGTVVTVSFLHDVNIKRP